MTLTRQQLAQTVAADLAPVFRASGLRAIDESGGMKEALDQTLRMTGVIESVLATGEVTEGNERRAIAFLRYGILSRAHLKMVMEGMSGQEVDVCKYLMNEAETVAVQFGWSALDPIPYAGGIDSGDYASLDEDTDREPKLFNLRSQKSFPYDRERWD